MRFGKIIVTIVCILVFTTSLYGCNKENKSESESPKSKEETNIEDISSEENSENDNEEWIDDDYEEGQSVKADGYEEPDWENIPNESNYLDERQYVELLVNEFVNISDEAWNICEYTLGGTTAKERLTWIDVSAYEMQASMERIDLADTEYRIKQEWSNAVEAIRGLVDITEPIREAISKGKEKKLEKPAKELQEILMELQPLIDEMKNLLDIVEEFESMENDINNFIKEIEQLENQINMQYWFGY